MELSASETGLQWQLWPPVEYSCQASDMSFRGWGGSGLGLPGGTRWMEGPGGRLRGWILMGLVQPDLGSHKSSQGLVVTQAGHHTFLSLSSRSFYRP